MGSDGGQVTNRDTGFISTFAHPQSPNVESLDTRYIRNFDRNTRNNQMAYTPATLREEAFGAVGGDYLDFTNPLFPEIKGLGGEDHATGIFWNYTSRPRESKMRGGTASGGRVIMPPELDMADLLTNFLPNDRGPLSEALQMTAPDHAWFGAGVPSTATGHMDSGFTWGCAKNRLLFNAWLGAKGQPVLTIDGLNGETNILNQGPQWVDAKGSLYVDQFGKPWGFIDTGGALNEFCVPELAAGALGAYGGIFGERSGFPHP